MNSPDSKLGYIDALRGVAILMVILVHTAQFVPDLLPAVQRLAAYGQMGVQLFFVASAYTLCISYEKRAHDSDRLVGFYLRRLFRIAPLYYLGILVYFFLYIALTYRQSDGSLYSLPYSFLDVVANVFFLHGFVPSANNTVVPGGWSIGTEMAFYAGFPAMFALASRTARIGLFVLPLLVALCFLSYIALQGLIYASTGLVIHNSSFFYFSIVNQFPAFAIGACAYFICRERPDWLSSSWTLSAKAFLVATGLALFLWMLEFDLLYAVIPAAAAVSFVFLLNCLRLRKPRLRFLQAIGRASFSMYIFHFLFAYYAVPQLFRAFAFPGSPQLVLLISYLLVCALTFPIALLTEQLIEAKGISLGTKMISFLRATRRVNSKYQPTPATR